MGKTKIGITLVEEEAMSEESVTYSFEAINTKR